MERGDLLTDVLDLARREGALEGEALEAFLTALRACAQGVEERLQRFSFERALAPRELEHLLQQVALCHPAPR